MDRMDVMDDARAHREHSVDPGRSDAMRMCLAASMLAIVSVSALIGGCARAQPMTRTGPMHSAAAPQGVARQADPSLPRARPAPLRTQRVGAELVAGMFVPYDNMSLPLVSPDGRFVATQTRVRPDWPTILAEFGADVPYATHIEIYSLPSDVARGEHPEIEFVAEIDEPALLGRSYDASGFLIEAPQEDGSRWIGHVTWETGAVTWLVADEHVNAFAALGPDGRLAWCRRAVDAADDTIFDLVIRSGDQEWTVETSARRPESWLMPTWSWRGDGLFILSLAEGRLDAVYAVATDVAAFRQSRQRIPLAIEASVFSAFQAVGAQTCGPGSTGAASEEPESLIFFHPSQMRMAIWQPRGRGGLTLLDRLSYAAVMHDREHALVSTEAALLLRPIARDRERAEMIVGMNVPRPVPASGEWRYVLLEPGDGRVAVMPMRPLQPRDLANR